MGPKRHHNLGQNCSNGGLYSRYLVNMKEQERPEYLGPTLYYTIVLLLLREDTNSVIIGVADLMR
jgi:hypothetical protein